jgi:hypothetical protein
MENNMLIPNHKWGLRQILSLCSPSNQQVNDRDKTILDKDATQPPQNAKIARLYEQGAPEAQFYRHIDNFKTVLATGLGSILLVSANLTFAGAQLPSLQASDGSAHYLCSRYGTAVSFDESNSTTNQECYDNKSFGVMNSLGGLFYGVELYETSINNFSSTIKSHKTNIGTYYVRDSEQYCWKMDIDLVTTGGDDFSNYSTPTESELPFPSNWCAQFATPTVPTVQFTAVSQSGAENGGTQTITAQLSAASGNTVSIPFTLSGTATQGAGNDYTITASPLTIPAGSTTATITITPINDSDYENDETVIVTIGTPTNATASGVTVHTATITNDDVQPPPVGAQLPSLQASDGSAHYLCSRYGTAVSFDESNSTTNQECYDNKSFGVMNSLGGLFSGVELYETSINNFSSTIKSHKTNIGTYYVRDSEQYCWKMDIDLVTTGGDDFSNYSTPTESELPFPSNWCAQFATPTVPTVQFTAVSQSGAENGGTQTITAQLSAASGNTVSIPFTLSGTATQGAGNDYTITASPLTIPAGSTTATITITPINDSDYENDETVIVTIGTPTNATASGVTVHTATITNDDVQPPPVGAQLPSLQASDGSAHYLCSRYGTAVSFDESNSTTNQECYDNKSFGVMNSLGGLFSGVELYETSINNFSSTIKSHKTNIGTYYVRDSEQYCWKMDIDLVTTGGDDFSNYSTPTESELPFPSNWCAQFATPTVPTVQFTAVSQSGAENGGTQTITAQLSAASGNTVSIPFTLSGTATQGAGNDYTITASPLTINAGSTSADITITVNNDSIDEADETVVVNMGTPTNATLGATTSHTATIQDDDTAGITPTSSNITIAEGGATGSYNLSLNTQPSGNVEIVVTADAQTQISRDGSAFDSSLTLTFTNSNWNSPQTITVQAVDDAAVESNHTSTITHAITGTVNDSNYPLSLIIGNVTANITDNDQSSTQNQNTPATPLPAQISLFVKMTGLGFGQVKSEPAGINCQTADEECKATFKTGTTIKLTATPDTGSEFSSWGGHSDCADGKVFLTGSLTCKPYFKLGPRTLTIVPAEQGTVSSQPEGISCGLDNPACAFTFDGGSKITLAATPNAGWLFDGWEGEGCENVLTLTQNLTCQPRFSLAPATPEDLQITQPDGSVITEITPSHTIIGQPMTQTITLTNNGATEMVLSDFTLPPGFQLTSPLPEKIAVGATVPLQVQLIAETEGVSQGNLSFNVNGQSVNYPLTGTVTAACADSTRLYVNQTAVGNQTGCNWLDAIPQLQMALTAIREGKFPAVKEIWIAKGTYKPTEDLNREASFALIDNLAIYGGFAGVETQLAERNSSENQTILSGDIGVVGDNSDNSFHVITSYGNQASAVLNGVIITAGNANGEGDYACGGGIFNDASQPTFKHILVSDNTAVTGGGMCNQNASQPLLTESMLENNTASEGGGMVNLNQSAPQLSDVTIIGNTANFAGAMLNKNSSPILMQTTITANSAPNSSGLVNQDGSQVQINNSTIWNNSANTEGLVEPQIIDENAQTVVNDSTVQGGFVGEGNTSELPDGNGIAQVDQGAFETPATYPFTVTLTGTGAGTVTTEGMVCGDECQQEYPGGQQIMLIAQAADGSQFLGWFGDCLDSAVQIEVEMTRAQQCQAQFDLIPTETTPSTDEETSTPVVTPPPTPSTTTTPVEPTVVMPIQNNCPTTGDFQVVCNAGGQVVTDLVVKEGGDLSNGIVETTLTNQGRVANLTITETGSVTGGTVTGLTHNQGMMSDFEFVGYKIEGQNQDGEIKGRLAGRILNRSPLPNAYFKNLRLAQNTHIEGNIILKGHILGEETAPATLNGVIIETGTHIANAVIEKGTTIKPKATLENVTLQGLEVERVTLSGRIQNSGGRFHQVKLSPQAQISSGRFSGTITGEANAPALIEETTIEAGTHLSHVRIGNNVVLADEVIFGAGVEFLNPPQCEAKAIALHPEAAEPIESTACFTGKLEIAKAEDVKLSFTMTPPIEAMGQPGEILIVVLYQPAQEGSPAIAFQRHGAKWRNWNGKPANLTTVERINALPYRLNVEIFEGDLSGLPGRFTIYTGIQLADETIHFNQEPMSFEIVE